MKYDKYSLDRSKKNICSLDLINDIDLIKVDCSSNKLNKIKNIPTNIIWLNCSQNIIFKLFKNIKLL